MPRTTRNSLVASGETYHVIARGSGRMKIFRDADDYVAYLDFLKTYVGACGVDVFHYVLMPNHVHLLLRPSEANLSVCMHATQLRYAKYYCKKYRRVGHVWQGRYKSFHVPTDSYLFACGNYIEMNPVRAKLVSNPESWPHSSYGNYAFGRRDPLVAVDPFYATLGATGKERQSAYRGSVAKMRRAD